MPRLLLNSRNAVPHRASTSPNNNGAWIRQSFIVLGCGMLIGYLVLPIVLLELQMGDQSLDAAQLVTSEFLSQGDTSSNSINMLRPVNENNKRTLSLKEGYELTDAEKRLVESYDILGTQSVPTSRYHRRQYKARHHTLALYNGE